tara:strand:- start:1931 stop:2830 length:900 start_codon:yes stop_codon:yes gene_type:complete
MKLLQFIDTSTDETKSGFIAGETIELFPTGTLIIDLVKEADRSGSPLEDVASKQSTVRGPSFEELTNVSNQFKLTIPLKIPEAWGAGVTYRKSAEFRDEEIDNPTSMYNQVYLGERPELFYKGDYRHAVGPNEAISIRADSSFTAPEPELAFVMDSNGRALAYSLCNDNSAWDIERENALYLPQSKVFYGCLALGPILVTTDDIPDPRAGELSATILRGGETLFEGSVDLSLIRREFADLSDYLTRNNPTYPGTVLTTGTGIIVPEDCALAHDDVVEIHHPIIGTLSNPVKKLAYSDRC